MLSVIWSSKPQLRFWNWSCNPRIKPPYFFLSFLLLYFKVQVVLTWLQVTTRFIFVFWCDFHLGCCRCILCRGRKDFASFRKECLHRLGQYFYIYWKYSYQILIEKVVSKCLDIIWLRPHLHVALWKLHYRRWKNILSQIHHI